jgi:hypothetical protein
MSVSVNHTASTKKKRNSLINLKENLADLLLGQETFGLVLARRLVFLCGKRGMAGRALLGSKVLLLKRGRDKPQNTGVTGIEFGERVFDWFLDFGSRHIYRRLSDWNVGSLCFGCFI